MKYPNLELLEYICLQKIKELYADVVKEKRFFKARSYVFPQTWPNTAIGMDLQQGFSGQAFTEAYTTVFRVKWCERKDDGRFYDSLDEICVVFFGDNLAYSFLNPNEYFFLDLTSYKMASQSEALTRYA